MIVEKNCWETFAETGKVADYLAYRGVTYESSDRAKRMCIDGCEAAEEFYCPHLTPKQIPHVP